MERLGEVVDDLLSVLFARNNRHAALRPIPGRPGEQPVERSLLPRRREADLARESLEVAPRDPEVEALTRLVHRNRPPTSSLSIPPWDPQSPSSTSSPP